MDPFHNINPVPHSTTSPFEHPKLVPYHDISEFSSTPALDDFYYIILEQGNSVHLPLDTQDTLLNLIHELHVLCNNSVIIHLHNFSRKDVDMPGLIKYPHSGELELDNVDYPNLSNLIDKEYVNDDESPFDNDENSGKNINVDDISLVYSS